MTIELLALAALAIVPHVAQLPQAVTNWFYVSFAASPDSNVVGYKVYVFTNSGMYQQVVDVGNQTVDNLIETTVPFPVNTAVRGYDANGNESDFSDMHYWNGAYQSDQTNGYTFWSPTSTQGQITHDCKTWSPITLPFSVTNPTDCGFIRAVGTTDAVQCAFTYHTGKWVRLP